jgi:hypothetical protein
MLAIRSRTQKRTLSIWWTIHRIYGDQMKLSKVIKELNKRADFLTDENYHDEAELCHKVVAILEELNPEPESTKEFIEDRKTLLEGILDITGVRYG